MIYHTHNFQQISGRGCQVLPWSWQSRSFLTKISHRPPEGRPTPRTTPGKARTGLLGEGGICMSSPCTAPLGWAWLKGKHTASCPARGALANLSPERQGERGRTKGGIGSTPVMQSGPPLLHRLFPKSDPLYGSSASIPLTWLSVSTRSPAARFRIMGHGLLSGTKICPVPKETGVHACSRCATGNPPGEQIGVCNRTGSYEESRATLPAGPFRYGGRPTEVAE